LLQFGANIHIKNKRQNTAFEIAKQQGFSALIQLFAEWKNSELKPEDNDMVLSQPGWVFEVGHKDLKLDDALANFRLAETYGTSVYNTYFKGKDAHTTLMGSTPEDGPLVISILNTEEGAHILFRTKLGDNHFQLAVVSMAEQLGDSLKTLTGYEFRVVKLSNPLVETEEKLEAELSQQDLKFGILYIKSGEFTDMKILESAEQSKQLDSFIELLGEKVPMVESVATIRPHQFCVATPVSDTTMLLFKLSTITAKDPSKKDVKTEFGKFGAVVIFLESYCFDVSIFQNTDISVIIVISPSTINPDEYRVAVLHKTKFNDFDPPLTLPAIYKRDHKFKEFLISKLLKAQRIAPSPSYVQEIMTQRQKYLETAVNSSKKLMGSMKEKAESLQGRDKYRMGPVLGSGAFAIAYSAQNKITKQFFCIKVVKKETMEEPQVKKQIDAESKILQKLNHPHIVRCIETFESSEGTDIVMEL